MNASLSYVAGVLSLCKRDRAAEHLARVTRLVSSKTRMGALAWLTGPTASFLPPPQDGPHILILLDLFPSKSYAKWETALKNWPVPVRMSKRSELLTSSICHFRSGGCLGGGGVVGGGGIKEA